jgi:hypothetical protein
MSLIEVFESALIMWDFMAVSFYLGKWSVRRKLKQ